MTTSTSMMLWMQSLSDQTRTRLLRLLEKNELTVVELCSILQLPQSTVSRHLKHLSDDGWIGARRDGTSNLYRMLSNDMDSARKRLWALVRDQGLEKSISELDESRLLQALAERRSRSQAFFSTAVDQWDHLRSDLFGTRIDAWGMAATLEPGSVVGDLGCGTGGISQMLAPWAKRVIAVDSSPAMLDAASRRLQESEHVEVRQGELTALPIDDGELNIAMLVLVLPYVEAPHQVFAEASRATRSGGRLIVLDMLPHTRGNYREELGHTWLGFHEKQLRDWLIESGWRPLRWQPLPSEAEAKGPGLFIMTALRN